MFNLLGGAAALGIAGLLGFIIGGITILIGFSLALIKVPEDEYEKYHNKLIETRNEYFKRHPEKRYGKNCKPEETETTDYTSTHFN